MKLAKGVKVYSGKEVFTEERTCKDCKVFQNFKEGDSKNPCFKLRGMSATTCGYFEKQKTEKVKK